MQGEHMLSDATKFPKQLRKKQVSLPLYDEDIFIAIPTGK